MDRKSRVKKSMVAVIALLLIVYVISSTYARYATSVSTNATTSVAKWAVALKQGATPITNSTNLTFTVQGNTNVVEGKIAPGVTATSVVTLELEDTEVAVDFVATVNTASAGLPSGITPSVSIVKQGGAALSGSTIDLPSGGGAFTSADKYDVTITLTWENDEANNSGDTALGVAGSNITIPVTLTVQQHIASGS